MFTILGALLGRDTEKKVQLRCSQQSRLCSFGAVAVSAEILWCNGKGREKWSYLTTIAFLRQTLVINSKILVLYGMLWRTVIKLSPKIIQPATLCLLCHDYQSLLELPFVILHFDLLTYTGGQYHHVQSTRAYSWQSATCGNKESFP